MDFRYSAENDDFRASLRGFLREKSSTPRGRDVADADGHDRQLWRRLCTEFELPGLHHPQDCGGAGGSLVDAAIAFEELGRELTPVPLAATAFAVESLVALGDKDQRARLLPGLLSGERIGALAASGPAITDPETATVRAHTLAGRTFLSGDCAPVLHGHLADLFVVPAATEGSVAFYLVTGEDPRVVVERLPSFDSTRPVARLRLIQAPAEPLSAGTPEAIDRVTDVARVLLAAEMLGGAEACLAMSVEYASSRKQFDRPIGSFQAIKHACAEMMIEIDATRVAVMFAAMSATEPGELRIAAPLVKAQAAETFTACAGSAIQIHGGIAFTWEHDMHRYFRRAKTTEALFGSSASHRALLGDRVGL